MTDEEVQLTREERRAQEDAAFEEWYEAVGRFPPETTMADFAPMPVTHWSQVAREDAPPEALGMSEDEAAMVEPIPAEFAFTRYPAWATSSSSNTATSTSTLWQRFVRWLRGPR